MKINKAKKNVNCALKIDMMKAYDNAEWDYLHAIMEKLSINLVWISPVMKCVRIVYSSVMCNGDLLSILN